MICDVFMGIDAPMIEREAVSVDGVRIAGSARKPMGSRGGLWMLSKLVLSDKRR